MSLLKKELPDVDLGSGEPICPKILVGQDHWELIVPTETRSIPRTSLALSRTRLGWTVHGRSGSRYQVPDSEIVLAQSGVGIHPSLQETCDAPDELHELVKGTFQLESLGITARTKSSTSMSRAETILQQTTHLMNGRWETGLLWNCDRPSFPPSKETAFRRLRSLEKSLDKDPVFAQQYYCEMKKLIREGYVTKLDEPQIDRQKEWYLPHFAVRNPNKPKRLRIVFDAAAKSGGVCLNDRLDRGLALLTRLLGVILRFRRGPVAFSGDIRDMFYRIMMRRDDWSAQLLLYRGMDREHPPGTYAVTTLVMGAKPSSCSAIYVKNVNARRFKDTMPKAVQAIEDQFYMDDFLDSEDSIEAALERIEQVIDINRQGGFSMHKWASNSEDVLQRIPGVTAGSATVSLDPDASPRSFTMILGLIWNPRSDTFRFVLSLDRINKDLMNLSRHPTKREVLSIVMSVFDPVGFLSPFTIRGRILLQHIWRRGTDWDEAISYSEFSRWKDWLVSLRALEGCEVPRCYLTGASRAVGNELHVFSDASSEAFAAVVYRRVLYEDGTIGVSFVASRTRVAPLKPTTIPRLELQAALIAARLVHLVQEELKITIDKRFFYTDSRTVLAWIRNDPRNFRPFVSFRLSEISDLSSTREWRWIPSTDNPADRATRDVPGDQSPNSRWLRGPDFLYCPTLESGTCEPVTDLGLHALPEVETTLIARESEPSLSLALPEIERFSTFPRLIRSTARVLQFVSILKKETPKNSPLTPELMERAERAWLAQSQRQTFACEVARLSGGLPLNKNSKIRKLTPITSTDGLLRAQGRIDKALDVPISVKQPILLDGEHPLTRLIVGAYHSRYLHGNHETVVNELRQKYWITKLRVTVRSVISNCQFCRLRRAKPDPPRMGDLPGARLAHHTRPFTFCDVDFFGPMHVAVGRRHEKRWGVIFTCLTTRAVHLELASSLGASSAIMALRRMAVRRGQPVEIHCDNGTNFRGADLELQEAVKEAGPEIIDRAAQYRTAWKFIPPGTPHMGGSWERLVQSIKQALRCTLSSRSPSEETLLTLLAEAEYTVNSRQLTHVSADPSDPEALTPNHFLMGSSSGSAFLGKFTHADLCSRKHWRAAQAMGDMFWQRWIKEYLPTLLKRDKWLHEAEPLKCGDVVVIVDHQLPRNSWPKGVVEYLYPGNDKRIRVVKVRTSRGHFIRPSSKLVRLTTAD